MWRVSITAFAQLLNRFRIVTSTFHGPNRELRTHSTDMSFRAMFNQLLSVGSGVGRAAPSSESNARVKEFFGYCETNDADMVLAHVLEDPSLIHSTDGKDLMSPLQVAAGYNAVDVCRVLVENGVLTSFFVVEIFPAVQRLRCAPCHDSCNNPSLFSFDTFICIRMLIVFQVIIPTKRTQKDEPLSFMPGTARSHHRSLPSCLSYHYDLCSHTEDRKSVV